LGKIGSREIGRESMKDDNTNRNTSFSKITILCHSKRHLGYEKCTVALKNVLKKIFFDKKLTVL
jgi:hypothetical protein